MSATDTSTSPSGAWFPGRVVGGVTLVLGPVVWCVGLLLRHLAVETAGFTSAQRAAFDRQMFDAPEELAAYQVNPGLVTAGYACFAAGTVLLCFAVVALARFVAVRSPRLAWAGGTLVMVGLFSRLYWAGVDHTAFQLVEPLGLKKATAMVLDLYTDISYGPWRIPITAAFGLYVGMPVLAAGAWRASLFGTGRLLLFLFAGTAWTGVLKGSGLFDGVAYAAALCAVLVPLGIRVLRAGAPAHGRGPWKILSW
ncbi:hypothetical protein [Streptomyces sp. NPDC048172]|uniref:hypothetical protein n=1 Tax=Streptomyces sp. NPDC048172 TaxID=3365505 RepID=UPI00371C31AE